ncbi:MAG: Fe-S cluster assembly protein SufD [Alphaproteobacteria bacterium]|nr:Fe-S cluster assembly protein SufD [Alphaproteobacteria bacterium]
MTSSVQPLTDPVVEKYRAQYAAKGSELPGSARDWVNSLRNQALSALSRNGLPTRRVESWKYTDLRNLHRAEFAAAAGAEVTAADLTPYKLEDAYVAVFVDGQYAPAFSDLGDLPEGLSFSSMADALALGNEELLADLGEAVDVELPGLGALNTALMQDGGVCRIADNVSVEKPIQLIFVSTENSSAEIHLRNLIGAGANSNATVMQSYVSLGASTGFCNVVTEAVLEQGANLRNVTHQVQSGTAWHIGLTSAQIKRDAHFESFVLSSGGRLSRNEIRVRLGGEGADCTLNGIALVRDRQHCDNTTDVDHAKSHCHSSQVYKNVLDDRSHTVFQGRVHVAPDAQKTDAHQMNRNLLLSRNAQADSKPELIIHADDVKCSHGATVGDLDQEALFYLQSRGIDAVTARNMMVQAFAAELVEAMPNDSIRSYLETAMSSWLETLNSVEEAA